MKLPDALVERLQAGAFPVTVWRNQLGQTQSFRELGLPCWGAGKFRGVLICGQCPENVDPRQEHEKDKQDRTPSLVFRGPFH